MQVLAGLCTGKVTLSYWMLQNTGQNVQEIDAAKCETTKDKAGTLPLAVYSNANPNSTARVFSPADQVEQMPTVSSERRSVVSDVSVLSFLSDATVPQLTLASTADFNQVEEYESDSDDSDNDVDIESEELVNGKPIMTRSGRQVKVWTRFDI